MNPSIYEPWPFAKPQARTQSETEKWLEDCFLNGPAQEMFINATHWRILAGGSGCGKTSTMLALEQEVRDQVLLVRYPTARWPGGTYVAVKGGNHLAQIMELAGWEIRKYITANPHLIHRLTHSQREFIRWLIQRNGHPRAFDSWVGGLPATEAVTFDNIEYPEIYLSTSNPQDSQGQVDELAGLVRKLELEKVLVTVDLNQTEAEAFIEQLGALFDWLDLFHHPGLALAATLPLRAIKKAGIMEKAKGRVERIFLHWDLEQVRNIGIRHARCALGDQTLEWANLAAGEVLLPLEELLLKEFGSPTPHGWVALAGALLSVVAAGETVPIEAGSIGEAMLKPELFVRGFPLLLDSTRGGVWRGPTYINLSPKKYEFLEALYDREGQPQASDSDLIAVAGSKGNINTLAKRVREAIEPDYKRPVYILNNGGYYLVNCNGFYSDRKLTGI